jgi:hypothetical protein
MFDRLLARGSRRADDLTAAERDISEGDWITHDDRPQVIGMVRLIPSEVVAVHTGLRSVAVRLYGRTGTPGPIVIWPLRGALKVEAPPWCGRRGQ